jgi:beta-N-acetylhexosaminidase
MLGFGGFSDDGMGKVSRLDFRKLASGCLMIGLPGPEIDSATAERVRSLDPAGVILFARNLIEFVQTRELLDSFRRLVERPPLMAIDQEGGRVSRLESWIGPTPTAARLAEAGEERVRAFALSTGRALRCIGFNLDFAPVVDLSQPGARNGIADRAFGTDPETVTRLAGAFLEGLQSTGVAGCLKHFPGLGDTAVDSHEVLPIVERNLDELERVDTLPYRRLVEIAACVMVGHGHYPALDGTEPRPATCSSSVVSGLLKDRLRYGGLIVSDDFEMGAVASRDAEGAASVEALAAGCDLILYCSDLDRAEAAVEALSDACVRRPDLRARLEQAASKVESLALEWPAAPAGGADEWSDAVGAFEAFRRIV